MPLETLEQPNVRDLTIKTPEKAKEYLFDPYKDIPEEKWQGLLDNLAECRRLATIHREDDWDLWSQHAYALKILRPDRVSELQLNEEAFLGLKNYLERHFLKKPWDNASPDKFLMSMRNLGIL